jgi:hypothetical protein
LGRVGRVGRSFTTPLTAARTWLTRARSPHSPEPFAAVAASLIGSGASSPIATHQPWRSSLRSI